MGVTKDQTAGNKEALTGSQIGHDVGEISDILALRPSTWFAVRVPVIVQVGGRWPTTSQPRGDGTRRRRVSIGDAGRSLSRRVTIFTGWQLRWRR
jgi:hypothetical protein